MPEANVYSQDLKQEADVLLRDTKIASLLQQFGEVILSGSYSYDLMVDRDLDFGVTVPAVTPEMRAEVASAFAAQTWAYTVTITDRVNFEPHSHLGAPRGLYMGLAIPFPDERWNVDVWFMIARNADRDPLAVRVESATAEQKQIMLQIKYDLMIRGLKEKGVTSAEIYLAVLDNGVRTTEEFLSH